jgi:hypothetical protein
MTTCLSVSKIQNQFRQLQNVVRLANVHIILQGHMLLIAQAEQSATKNLHLKKTVKVIQLASCYESRHGYLAIGG